MDGQPAVPSEFQIIKGYLPWSEITVIVTVKISGQKLWKVTYEADPNTKFLSSSGQNKPAGATVGYTNG